VHEEEEPAIDYVLFFVLFVALLVLWPSIAIRRVIVGVAWGGCPELSEEHFSFK
jgi:hypothetical protein